MGLAIITLKIRPLSKAVWGVDKFMGGAALES